MLGLTFAGVVVVIFAMPLSTETRKQVLGLLGLMVSGVFAFSATTAAANLTAGLMLRVTKPFYTGDFIRVEGFSGRVTERGLLDTEIQSEDRELVAIPNMFLISRPVSVTRSSGAMVSCSLSLGYDMHHGLVEKLLCRRRRMRN